MKVLSNIFRWIKSLFSKSEDGCTSDDYDTDQHMED